jgi:hypothetical protein
MKKRVYHSEFYEKLPLTVLNDVRAILLDGVVIYKGDNGTITFSIKDGLYHDINDEPSYVWDNGLKKLCKWFEHDKLIKYEVVYAVD